MMKVEARHLALRFLLELERKGGIKLALLDDQTLERDFGWVFFYNSQKYLESQDFRDMLGRVLINRGSYASSTLVRYRAYCRLKPDIASGPKTAKWRHARASALTRLGVRSGEALHLAVAGQSSFS
jgi:hypothetical protein